MQGALCMAQKRCKDREKGGNGFLGINEIAQELWSAPVKDSTSTDCRETSEWVWLPTPLRLLEQGLLTT